MTTYVLNSLAWSLLGLVIGFALGWVVREVQLTREEPGHSHLHGPDPRVLGISIIVLALMTVGGMTLTTITQTRQQTCQTNYNARFVIAFRARAAAGDADRKALNDMLIAIGDAKATPAQRKSIYEAYIAQIRAGNASRAAHPLPEPPDPRNLCNNE